MKCSIPGCLVAHDINVIDKHNIWDVYESFPEEDKIRALILWKRLYQRAIDGSSENTDLDFACSVVEKCKELLKNYSKLGNIINWDILLQCDKCEHKTVVNNESYDKNCRHCDGGIRKIINSSY